MKKNNHIIYEDTITNYGITIIKDKMYLIKNGKTMKLDSLIIKESRRESN
jgi:hypothetical protein